MRMFVFFTLLCVAACGSVGIEPKGSTFPAQDPALLAPCGADKRSDLVGMSLEQLMQVEILGPVRVIRPGDAVTEDFFPARLNIYLTATDHVTALACG